MDQYRKHAWMIFFTISAIIIVADQITKYVISNNIPFNVSDQLVPGFLNLVHVRNSGAAFGIFAHNSSLFSRGALSAVSFMALIITVWIVTSQRLDRSSLVGFSLFFGGAAGNFIDRLLFGEVIDFIDVHLGDLHWPAFNIADSALTIGAVIFCIRLIFTRQVNS